MDLYRTFPNLLYLTAGRSLPWIPEMVTWTLITVSIDHQFILGCKVGRLSNLMQFYLPPCIVPRESCFVWAGVEVIQSFFLKLKSKEQLQCSSKSSQASAKQLPQDISSVANPPQPSRVAFAPPP